MLNLNLIARPTTKWIAGAAAAIALMSLASAAGAVTLSTGVGSLGSSELNWGLTSSPGSTTLTIVSGAADFPGAWVGAPGGSNWITPYAVGGTATNAPLGDYTYSSQMFAHPLASVTIQWSSDNGARFFLNGDLLNTLGTPAFGTLTSFLIPFGSFSGSNQFEVIVNNADDCPSCLSNPTGLLVSTLSITEFSVVTPLPAALPLFAGGLGALGLLGWRRKRKAAAIAA